MINNGKCGFIALYCNILWIRPGHVVAIVFGFYSQKNPTLLNLDVSTDIHKNMQKWS